MADNVKVLVVGVGNMGLSHAKAYQSLGGFEIVGLTSRSIRRRAALVTTSEVITLVSSK